jgi:AcrR family transcriptional regulator
MDAVAERAGVSRPLVYKHFANREQLLVELFRREAKALHEQMTTVVRAAGSIEGMFRALVRSALQAAVERGPLFGALRSAGTGIRGVGRDQRERDRATSRAFARRAASELGIDVRTAATPIRLLLGLIDQVLVQFRANPTPSRAAHLEDAYMTIVSATLSALGGAAS